VEDDRMKKTKKKYRKPKTEEQNEDSGIGGGCKNCA
jgi:hypothetical protein